MYLKTRSQINFLFLMKVVFLGFFFKYGINIKLETWGGVSHLNSQFDILKVTKAFGGKQKGSLQMSSNIHSSIWRLRSQVLQQVGASCQLTGHIHAEL